MGLTAFIVTMLVMVVFHEWGHYITAKKFGIKVEEFFVGFGPRIFSRRRGETEFGLKAILLGGYVKIAGMNPFQEITDEERPRTFGAKPAWQRAIVLSAGSFTHFILATVLFAGMFGVIGVPDRLTTTVDMVVPEIEGRPGPASEAGIEPGDTIVQIDGTGIETWDDVREAIRPTAGQTIEVVVERDGEEITRQMTPVPAEVPVDAENLDETETVGQIGIGPEVHIERSGPIASIVDGTKMTGEMIVLSITGVGKIVHPGISEVLKAFGGTGERELTEDQPIGLVGGARIAGQATAAGNLSVLVSFLGSFIVFVGVINLAPLPPLDGGHLLVLGLEKLLRREIDARKVIPAAAAVLVFFVLLGGALVYLDIARPMQNPFQ
ncbi:MAG: site-2 protease family protein [Actinomycetota bacterium]